jgi:hypothetical protein
MWKGSRGSFHVEVIERQECHRGNTMMKLDLLRAQIPAGFARRRRSETRPCE